MLHDLTAAFNSVQKFPYARSATTESIMVADIELCLENPVDKTECFETSMKVREESETRISRSKTPFSADRFEGNTRVIDQT